jgi:hypothetical protein
VVVTRFVAGSVEELAALTEKLLNSGALFLVFGPYRRFLQGELV